MKKKFDQVYQFKITLEGIRPPIWRRIHLLITYTISAITGITKYNWIRYFPERKISHIQYASKEKEHVRQKTAAGSEGMNVYWIS